ncbi:leishmanolysin-related zinc metalloendopeptidase [Thalassovita aquimarina]|uniref:Leishmanolysin n=1 Tax=Thalassovita aquimarina TaxID=2785917 RepID=A0ABS5HSI6_9RHOB|nr:leishmanolysin-related zinc metalloendopeptidase [Thalassovita aquimarina]MBR9651878.1 hypothetical protein [Thalassovita aquimarina]
MAFELEFFDPQVLTGENDDAAKGGERSFDLLDLAALLEDQFSWLDGPGDQDPDEFHFTTPEAPALQSLRSPFSSHDLNTGDTDRIDGEASAKPDGAGGGKGGGGGSDGGGGGGGKGGGKGGKSNDGGDTGLLTEYVSSAEGSDFNIEIVFNGTWTSALQDAFVTAADFISSIILGDVADILSGPYATDDITITAELADIDGSGGILGQAGPTVYRTADYLPVAGIMQFDVADAEYFDGLALFDDIVFHEMMHTIGFGTMWDLMGLTSGSITTGDLTFAGAMATEVYNTDFVALSGGTATGVPIEMDGGAGTAGGHWDEVTFGSEIMTGYINASNYLSEMSVAALEDMGYDTYLDNPLLVGDLTGSDPLSAINGTLFA